MNRAHFIGVCPAGRFVFCLSRHFVNPQHLGGVHRCGHQLPDGSGGVCGVLHHLVVEVTYRWQAAMGEWLISRLAWELRGLPQVQVMSAVSKLAPKVLAAARRLCFGLPSTGLQSALGTPRWRDSARSMRPVSGESSVRPGPFIISCGISAELLRNA